MKKRSIYTHTSERQCVCICVRTCAFVSVCVCGCESDLIRKKDRKKERDLLVSAGVTVCVRACQPERVDGCVHDRCFK